MVRAVAMMLLCVASAAAQAPAFDVATIKPSLATDGHHHIYWHPENGDFQTINVSVKELLATAYDLPESRMIGGPAWLGADVWDAQAKSSAEVDAQIHAMKPDEAKAEKQRMLQAARFRLVVHQETRELPLYALVVMKGGPKFEHAEGSGTNIGTGNSHITISGGDSLAILAAQLARVTGRVVLDRTGLVGRFNITLRWTPENGLPDRINGASSPEETNGPSIYTAIQEQLGLKLDAQKGPVKVLVIESVERPSAN